MNANPTAYLVIVSAPPSTPLLLAPNTLNVPGVGQSWTLLPGKNVVGRELGPDVTVVLPWKNVSRRHAQIELFAQGMWEIEDQSRNGTEVNGQKLQPNALSPLSDGDRIRIGAVELVFCFHLDPLDSIPTIDDQVR